MSQIPPRKSIAKTQKASQHDEEYSCFRAPLVFKR